MISQFKQGLYNKNFSLQDQGKGNQIDTLQKRTKFQLNVIIDTGYPITDDFYNYEYNYEGLDSSACSSEIFREIRKCKKVSDLLRCI